MLTNWDLVSKLLFPVLTAIIVAAIAKRREDRPRLVTYIAHAAGFALGPSVAKAEVTSSEPDVDPSIEPVPTPSGEGIHVHGIVIRNAGKKTAFDVRIGHNAHVRQYVIEPPVQHEMVQAPAGGWEIVIPTLVPNEQIRISYLYFAPVVWQQVNTYTKSNEGFASFLNVLPTPQPRRWAVVVVSVFFYFGIASAVFALISAGQWCIAVSHLLRIAAPTQ